MTLQGPIPPELFCGSENENTVTSNTNPRSLKNPKHVWMLIEQKMIFPEHFQRHKKPWRYTSVEVFASPNNVL